MVPYWYVPYTGAVSGGMSMVWENLTLGIPMANLMQDTGCQSLNANSYFTFFLLISSSLTDLRSRGWD
jgi:hypothetical protein